ncbi:MAG: SDR family oxidoreductase [Myxococcota bacterium]
MTQKTNARVLIVGGTAGMGLACAAALCERGMEVVIGGRSTSRLQQALESLPAGVVAQPMDMMDPDSVQRAVRELSTLDHLILAASGSVAWGPVTEVSAEDLERAMLGKVVGYWRVLRAVLPILHERGSITLFSGAASRKAMRGTAALAAVNGAINQMARTLAVELAPIRVNVVSPGLIETSAYDGMPADARRAMFDAAAQSLPVARIGTAQEVAHAVLMLTTNAYATGALLDIDGGTQL